MEHVQATLGYFKIAKCTNTGHNMDHCKSMQNKL